MNTEYQLYTCNWPDSEAWHLTGYFVLKLGTG